MAISYPFIYFCDRRPNNEDKLVIHTARCPRLAKELDRIYIGIALSPTQSLQRASKTFPTKSFILCSHCCNESDN